MFKISAIEKDLDDLSGCNNHRDREERNELSPLSGGRRNMIKMLRDRRKSLNLEYRKSLPIDRLVKGERRGSFAAFITPSSLSGSPERKKSERRGSFAALISPSSLRTSPERAAKRRESFASTNHHHHHHNNNNDSNFLHPSSAGDGKVRHERRGSLVQR